MFTYAVRAFKNDTKLYSEIKGKSEVQSASLRTILSIVGLAALISGVVTGLSLIFPDVSHSLSSYPGLILFAVVGDVFTSVLGNSIGYLLLAGWAWIVGTKIGKGQGSFKDVRVALAYGYSPILLSYLPWIGWIFGLWSLVTSSSAIRETLGIGKGQTFFIVLSAGALQVFVVLALIGSMVTAVMLTMMAVFPQ